ncbi:hypothetical protein [Cryptosporangium minutisporangium]|uniref:DUF4440 domain-containing protein n=1 Tax=Cryptosporangium minutisporangium TaxID=113569 RepID=A0ABP6TAY8_9ACTN
MRAYVLCGQHRPGEAVGLLRAALTGQPDALTPFLRAALTTALFHALLCGEVPPDHAASAAAEVRSGATSPASRTPSLTSRTPRTPRPPTSTGTTPAPPSRPWPPPATTHPANAPTPALWPRCPAPGPATGDFAFALAGLISLLATEALLRFQLRTTRIARGPVALTVAADGYHEAHGDRAVSMTWTYISMVQRRGDFWVLR